MINISFFYSVICNYKWKEWLSHETWSYLPVETNIYEFGILWIQNISCKDMFYCKSWKNMHFEFFEFRIQIVETCFIVKVNQEKL